MTLLLGSQLVSIEGATDAFIVACVNVDINFYVLPSINMYVAKTFAVLAET